MILTIVEFFSGKQRSVPLIKNILNNNSKNFNSNFNFSREMIEFEGKESIE